MAMKNYTKNEEELTCRFKTDMRKFTNFHSSTQKFKNCSLIGSFDQCLGLEKYRGVMSNDIEN